MKLLVNNPPPHPDACDFIQPRSFNGTGKTRIWAADNDAFGNFNITRFMRMVDRIAEAPVKPKFLVAPDEPFPSKSPTDPSISGPLA
jgi:hypothetical protein